MLSVLGQALELCSGFGGELEKCRQQIERIENSLQRDRLLLERQEDSENSDFRIDWEQIDKLNVLIFRTIRKLNQHSSKVITVPFDEELYRHDYVRERLDEGVHGITARRVGSAVFFYAPILDTRKEMRSSAQKNNPFSKQNSNVYSAGLSRAFEYLIETTDIDLMQYSKKTIAFFFVSDQGNNAPDNDNYNIGAAINAIAGKTYGGDSPDCCRIVLDSIFDTKLPAGTYNVLQPYDLPLPTKAEIADYWMADPAPGVEETSLEEWIKSMGKVRK